MKFTIIGHKNLENEELTRLVSELQEAENILPYSSPTKEAIKDLRWKVQMELNKRERSKKVWVEFVAIWSGYSQPASRGQRREVGRFYRKLNRSIADKLPSFYSHSFTDNTTNDWSIRKVSVKGKDSGSYSQQVDEIISKAMKG